MEILGWAGLFVGVLAFSATMLWLSMRNHLRRAAQNDPDRRPSDET